MNQPKFKFGDKVQNISNKEIFEIWFVYRDSEAYRYASCPQTGRYHMENLLELYQEPQKKKLYAFRMLAGKTIYFRESEGFTQATGRENYYLNTEFIEERAPEYDIEYPDV